LEHGVRGGRRFGAATASAAFVCPLWFETEPERGTIRFFYPTADGKITRFVAQPEDSPDEWTLRMAYPDREATKRLSDDEMTRLAAISRDMRAAIDAFPKAELPESMSAFPAGCCHAASILLGTYLADCGEQGFLIICGDRGSREEGTWTSHAWLARGDLIIDITADQFLDAPARVIVESNSQWHRSFEWTGSEPSDLRARGDNAPGLLPLRPFYARLKDSLTRRS
jgi:hypothetical protein